MTNHHFQHVSKLFIIKEIDKRIQNTIDSHKVRQYGINRIGGFSK